MSKCSTSVAPLFIDFSASLCDLLGKDYVEAVLECTERLHGLDSRIAREVAFGRQSFYSSSRQAFLESLLPEVGRQFVEPFNTSASGATTLSYMAATNLKASPLGGIGPFRVGEDGLLYFTAKSEHYQASLGHGFEGYRLIDRARTLGILNSTHNNTRGHITRLLEQELVRCINGLGREQQSELERILKTNDKKVLNRVINLETGSLAVEAGLKMMLARFYRFDISSSQTKYEGRIPVFLVIGDAEGRSDANYHGTTLTAQMIRGLWPEMYRHFDMNDAFKVVPVRKNDSSDFHQKIVEYNSGAFKTAGFLHEIILMNHGGVRLTEAFLQNAYRDCEDSDTPTLVDEIQSCMWFRGMFLFRNYDLHPDFVVLGKGFPGGEYPASKIITTFEMDNLVQFGALVTNGQEELASLAYLITMEFAQRNADAIEDSGTYFEEQLDGLSRRQEGRIQRIEGRGHLAAIHFETIEEAIEFARRMNERCIDISAQTYKTNCPPAVLLKPPIILTKRMIDFLVRSMEESLYPVS